MQAVGWRRGFAWKDDKFYSFEKASIVVMRLWPVMLAWRCTKTKAWSPTRRYADECLMGAPLSPGELERYAMLRTTFGGPLPDQGHTWCRFKSDFAAVVPAFATIPDRERCIAAKFHERRWHVLALMARCPGAADLLEANPALGFALANSWATTTQDSK